MNKKNFIDMYTFIRLETNISNRLALTKVDDEKTFMIINDNILTLLNILIISKSHRIIFGLNYS